MPEYSEVYFECPHCGTTNQCSGIFPQRAECWNCQSLILVVGTGHAILLRRGPRTELAPAVVGGGILGGIIGAAIGGPAGALIGLITGAALGQSTSRPPTRRRPQ